MTVTVFFGISALTALSIIAVPAIGILGSYSVYMAVTDVGGFSVLKDVVPIQTKIRLPFPFILFK